MKISTRKLLQFTNRLLRDEAGAEVLEYVLILGLIVVITIATLILFGNKLVARWTTVNGSM